MPITSTVPLVFAEMASEPGKMDVYIGRKGHGVVQIGQYGLDGSFIRREGIGAELDRMEFEHDAEGRIVIQ